MNDSFSASYAAAGVDVTAGYESVELIKSHVKRTEIPGVMGSIGGFGGMFELLGAGDYKILFSFRVLTVSAQSLRLPFFLISTTQSVSTVLHVR